METFLSGEIPDSLGTLQNLSVLDLGFNQLSGSIPSSLGSLPHLTNLIPSHNKLSGPLPQFISPVLYRIDLNPNDLSGPVQAGSFPLSMQYFSLSWNQLSGPARPAELPRPEHEPVHGQYPGPGLHLPYHEPSAPEELIHGPSGTGQPSDDPDCGPGVHVE